MYQIVVDATNALNGSTSSTVSKYVQWYVPSINTSVLPTQLDLHNLKEKDELWTYSEDKNTGVFPLLDCEVPLLPFLPQAYGTTQERVHPRDSIQIQNWSMDWTTSRLHDTLGQVW